MSEKSTQKWKQLYDSRGGMKIDLEIHLFVVWKIFLSIFKKAFPTDHRVRAIQEIHQL